MGSFVYVQYIGEDAGAIVAHMLVTEDEPSSPAEVASKIERVVGFQPNEMEETEETEEGEDDD